MLFGNNSLLFIICYKTPWLQFCIIWYTWTCQIGRFSVFIIIICLYSVKKTVGNTTSIRPNLENNFASWYERRRLFNALDHLHCTHTHTYMHAQANAHTCTCVHTLTRTFYTHTLVVHASTKLDSDALKKRRIKKAKCGLTI